MNKQATSYTTLELARRGLSNVPDEFISGKHLIYSSPATLDFNSPGAQSFGVKRAGLSIPGSVMLLVSPGCCGRNTTLIAEMPEYKNRFFYLNMDQTDIITGRHLRKVPDAVEEVCRKLEVPPTVVMICITCVDALLGTDMERVCRKAEERVGLPVRPCYMYALTREGRKPPMVHVRQSLYSLLQPMKKRGTSVNLLGYFAPLDDDCELYSLLRGIGIKQIRELSRCQSYDEYLHMAEANFNLVLNPEARFAAADMQKKLNIPSIELRQLYQIEKIHNQYVAFGQVLGVTLDDADMYKEARACVDSFTEKYGKMSISVGECLNGDPFELSLALVQYGFKVPEIYGTITEDNFVFIRRLAELTPDTKVYSNLEPTMLYHRGSVCEQSGIDLTLGKDAAYYRPDVPNVSWDSDRQPFGYQAVKGLFAAMAKTMENTSSADDAEEKEIKVHVKETDRVDVHGLRLTLAPFAPDQSGAVSVLYALGGIVVICDAGGCTGNICGFDEPRWQEGTSAIFSAGLRDMDAVMGRDDQLVEKVRMTVEQIDANFVAIIGTPVPAVIGTDYRGLRRMLEKKTDIPILTIDTDGTLLYDKGCEKAYEELFRVFAKPVEKEGDGKCIGVLGANPLDIGGADALQKLKNILSQDWEQVNCYGAEADLNAIRDAAKADLNLVVSLSGLKAAKYLKRTFGTPYEIGNPLAASLLPENLQEGSRVLIVHEQVTVNAMREELLKRGSFEVENATWFQQRKLMAGEQDHWLKEEADFIKLVKENPYDVIMADSLLKELVPFYEGEWFDLPHFAVSGRID